MSVYSEANGTPNHALQRTAPRFHQGFFASTSSSIGIRSGMGRSKTVVAGIAWFRSDQWQLLRSLASDADTLEQTHAEWESLAEKTIKDLAGEGLLARKVDVDVNDLRVWCIGLQRPLDAAARAAYAAARLRDDSENA